MAKRRVGRKIKGYKATKAKPKVKPKSSPKRITNKKFHAVQKSKPRTKVKYATVKRGGVTYKRRIGR